MILVKRLNGTSFYVNPHLIQYIEETPDCVITLVSGTKIVVKDKAADVVADIVKYRKTINFISSDKIVRESE